MNSSYVLPIKIFSPATFKHVKSATAEQVVLHRKGKLPKRKITQHQVVLKCKGFMCKTSGTSLVRAFSTALIKLLEDNDQVKRVIVSIRFRWNGCPHWRHLPCEFGKQLHKVRGDITFRYSRSCKC